jgi:hypothetical protein
MIKLANAFASPTELAAFIRTQPQELDFGDPSDGPRLPCIPSQRLRLLPAGYNCFENTELYLRLADIIDPGTPRTSCTVRIGGGYHTLPIERGRPVILDPEPPPRNAINALVYTCQRRAGHRPSLVDARESHPWLFETAGHAARTPVECQMVRNAAQQVNLALYGGAPMRDLQSIAEAVALAERDASMWGQEGTDALREATRNLRNLQTRIDLGQFVGLAGRLSKRALKAYLVAQTGPVGLALIEELDRQLAGQASATERRAAGASKVATMAALSDASAKGAGADTGLILHERFPLIPGGTLHIMKLH